MKRFVSAVLVVAFAVLAFAHGAQANPSRAGLAQVEPLAGEHVAKKASYRRYSRFRRYRYYRYRRYWRYRRYYRYRRFYRYRAPLRH